MCGSAANGCCAMTGELLPVLLSALFPVLRTQQTRFEEREHKRERIPAIPKLEPNTVMLFFHWFDSRISRY